MKNKNKLWIIGVLCVLFFASCSTTVQVKNLLPSEVNMGAYKNLAVTSCQPFNNSIYWSHKITEIDLDRQIDLPSLTPMSIQTCVAKYCQDALFDSLEDSKFFTLTDPELTSDLISVGNNLGNTKELFTKKGINAILATKITYLDYREYIYKKDKTETDSNGDSIGKDYYLHQEVAINLSYSVIDVLQNSIITTGSMSDEEEKETLVGTYLIDDGTGSPSHTQHLNMAPALGNLFTVCIDGFVETIRTKLAPVWTQTNVSLMKNSPKLDSVEDAYKQVRKNNLMVAYNTFISAWDDERHISSGYNAAVVLQAMGKLEESISLMEEVYNYSGNSSIFKRLSIMRKNLEDYNEASDQISGIEKETDSQLDVFSLESFFSD
ncbi:MAG: hypothetical protein PHD05_03795 [Sphaerochaetaceae bacterium]|nr:hypothetical protein [Sphaerochaetaceae bacterium]